MLRTGSHRMRAGVALGVLALVLTACGSDDSSSPTGTPNESESTSAAGGDSTLVVWADNSANTGKAVEPLCKAWAEANGVTCVVKMFNGGPELEDALVRGNETGDVPDIYEGPHDPIGRLVGNGILAPVDISANADKFAKEAVAAMQYQGNSYGVPWAVENVAMFANKKLSPECPTSLDEAVANAKSSSARARPPTASASPCRSVRPATSTPGTRSSPPTAATPSPAIPTAPTTPTTWVSAPLVASRPPSGSSSSPTRASSSPR